MSLLQHPAWGGLDVQQATISDEYSLGQVRWFNVGKYTTSEADRTLVKGAMCEAIYCSNQSGGTLAPGIRVLWDNDGTDYSPGFATGAAAGADVPFAGFVTPFAGTIAAGAGFWLITKGVTQVGYDGSANFAVRDNLQGAASGWVSEWSNYADLHLGFILEAKTSGTAGDLLWAYVDVWR